MKARSLPILAGALGVTLAFTALTLADEPERKERPQVEKTRLQVEVEAQRDRAEAEKREIESRRPEARRDGREEEALRLRANAESWRAMMQELIRSGFTEEAAQVKRRQDEMESRRGEPEEVERRMKHLAIAAENLHAAGNHELAENLQRQVEQMKRQMQEPRGPGFSTPRQPSFNQPGNEQPEPGQARPGQPGRGQPGREQPAVDPRTDELHAVVRRLNSEVQELREQVQEMRKQIEPRKK